MAVACRAAKMASNAVSRRYLCKGGVRAGAYMAAPACVGVQCTYVIISYAFLVFVFVFESVPSYIYPCKE